MVEKLTGMDWLKKHIKELEVTSSQHSLEISKVTAVSPNVYNEFQTWTPLKLILLDYALDVCTTVIKKTDFIKERYFVDLFAGSGLNKVKNKNDFLIGSPFIASLKFSDDYTEMIFCEKDPTLFNALNARIGSLAKSNLSVVNCNCNSNLAQIVNKVNKKDAYSLFFVDPCNTEFSWNSMKLLLNARTDIIFNFMSNQIRRTAGLCRDGTCDGTILDDFFGDNSWRKWQSGDEELLQIYIDNILKERKEAVIKTIKIKSAKHGFCYFLLFITNKTKKENPWLKAIDKAKSEIESNSDKSVETALDLVKNRQKTLF